VKRSFDNSVDQLIEEKEKEGILKTNDTYIGAENIV
jgi:hypothetical protein